MKLLLRLVLPGLLLAATTLARAGMQQVPCDRPFVFSGAAVNVVVLPFALPEHDSPVADHLSRLVQREVLRSIAKFGSVGSVQLTQTHGEPCTPDVVRAQLLGQSEGALARIDPQRGLILVWGRIIEQGQQLYWQTFIDFVRRGVRESIELPLSQDRLAGQLGAQGFAGPQRRIDRALLEKIDATAQRTSALYEEPNEASRRTEIPPDLPFYYYVTEIRGDWMRVAAFTPDAPPRNQMQLDRGVFAGRHWMKAVAAEDAWTLRRVMPEIAFVEGLAGFLALRGALASADSPPGLPSTTTTAGAARRALEEYDARIAEFGLDGEKGLIDGRYAAARGVTLELRGMIELLDREPSVESMRMARAQFVAASRLQPASADARNLALIADLWLAEHHAGATQPPVGTLDALRATWALAPDNTLVQRNLRVAHRWVLGLGGKRPAEWGPLDEATEARLRRMLQLLEAK